MMNDEEMKANIGQMLEYSRRSYPPGKLARPITFPEVQVGDTIRAEKPTGVVRVMEGRVARCDTPGLLRLVDVNADPTVWLSGRVFTGTGWSLTLLDRPEPDRPVGSLWWHPLTDTGWVTTDHDGNLSLFKGTFREDCLFPREPDHRLTIDALVPWRSEPAKPVPCPVVRDTWPIIEPCILPAGHDKPHCDGAGRRFAVITQYMGSA